MLPKEIFRAHNKKNHRRSSKQYPSEKFFSGRIKIKTQDRRETQKWILGDEVSFNHIYYFINNNNNRHPPPPPQKMQ